MPTVRLEDALLELDEERETALQLQHLADFGTDDPEEVRRCEAMLIEDWNDVSDPDYDEWCERQAQRRAADNDWLGDAWDEWDDL